MRRPSCGSRSDGIASISVSGLTAELDLYDGSLEGHQLVEVEFDDDDAADDFEPPDWFGREVTEDNRYTNSSLARYGWPD